MTAKLKVGMPHAQPKVVKTTLQTQRGLQSSKPTQNVQDVNRPESDVISGHSDVSQACSENQPRKQNADKLTRAAETKGPSAVKSAANGNNREPVRDAIQFEVDSVDDREFEDAETRTQSENRNANQNELSQKIID